MPSKKMWAVGITSLAITLAVYGAEYHIAPAGDDKNPGTAPEKPWATLKHGLAALRSGDTLIIAEGEYRPAAVALNGVPEKDEDISKPIVIRAARPHTAVIHGDVMLRSFEKTAGRNCVYQIPFKENIGAVVESDTDIVYEPTNSPDDLDETVAAYLYDSQQELLFVHTTDGLPPEKHVLKALVDRAGINYRLPTGNINRARSIVLDGLVFKGFVFAGLDMRQVRNVTVTNCVFFHNCYGLYLGNYARHCRVANNLLFANNIRRHGSAENAPIVIAGDVDDIVVDGNLSRYNRFNSIRAYSETIPKGGRVVFSNNRSFGEAPLWFKPPAAGGAMIGNVSEGFIRAYINVSNTCPGMSTAGVENQPIDNALVYTNTPATIAAARFADTVNEDYRLQSDSPFRGKGTGGSDPGALPYKGDVFFVKPGGDDGAQGTSIASAWRSLDKAAERLQAGYTLYILPGSYRGGIVITQKGNADQPVILRRHGKGKVILDGAGQEQFGIELKGASHVRIEGLEMKGFKTAAVMGRESENVRIEECLAHDNGQAGLSFDKCGQVVLRNNSVVNNGIGIDVNEAQPGLELVNNILQGNSKTQLRLDKLPGEFYGNFNCWHGNSLACLAGKDCLSLEQLRLQQGEGKNSIGAEPRFENSAGGDFRLQVGSPCRGRGQFERTIGRNDLMPVVPEKLEVNDVRVHYAGATTATITYWTQVPSYSLVEYGSGEGGSLTNELTLERRIFHVVNLTGLKPDREYWFRGGAKYPSESWIDYTRRAGGQASGPKADACAYGERRTFKTLAAEPAGRKLYVVAEGSDANDGLSAATAWQTLRKASREARAGDTVTIGNGRYFETITPYNSGAGDDRRIVFRAETPRGVIIDGNNFGLPNAVKLIGKNYITLDGFRFEYQNANASGMSGINPWSEQVLISQARFCALSNCYFNGADKFPGNAWTALMGVRLDDAEGAVIENNFFFLETWAIWTTTRPAPVAGYVPPLIKNNTFFIQYIWVLHVTGRNDYLKLRNNLFAEYVRAKSGHAYLSIWSATTRIDSDYNFFYWYNEKRAKPEIRRVAKWDKLMSNAERQPNGIDGGLAAWQKLSGQDLHSLEGYFQSNNLYDQLDFTIPGKPYAGKGEHGADIGCTWIGKHTDKVVLGDRNSKIDIPPWKDK